MNLLETIIEKFDGVIIEDNQWTVEGSNGKRYIVEWDKYNKKYRMDIRLLIDGKII